MILKRYIFAIVIVLIAQAMHGKSIWIDKNIYSSSENLKIGDIVIVNVNDISQMRFNLDLSNASSSSINTNPDVTITGFLPRISANNNSNNSSTTQFSGAGQLNISIASRVVRKEGEKNYSLSGTRTYSFNGVASTITVSGIVDPSTINGRSVNSTVLAGFRLEIKGSSEGVRLERKKLEKDEKASIQLSEDEKQKIISEYLEKMIRELTR